MNDRLESFSMASDETVHDAGARRQLLKYYSAPRHSGNDEPEGENNQNKRPAGGGGPNALWMAHMERKLSESWKSTHASRDEPTADACWLRSGVVYMIQLAQVNPAGSKGFGPSVERRHLPRWSKLVELYYVYFTIKLAICLVAQHEYNQLYEKIQTMAQSSHENASMWLTEGHHHQQLTDELARSTEWLHYVGAPWRELRYPIEILYSTILVFSAAAYVVTRIGYYKAGQSKVARFILNPDKERRSINKEMCQLADEFLVSSGNYLRVCREANRMEVHRSMAIESGSGGAFIETNSRSINRNGTHLVLFQDVSELLLSGHLMPLNRNNKWLQKLVSFSGSMFLQVAITSAVTNFIIVAIVPYYEEENFYYLTGPADVLFMVEITLYLALFIQLASFYATILTLTPIDQIEYALKLRQLIQDTIWRIDQTSGVQFDQKCPSERAIAVRRLHMDIVAVMIQLKMFQRQLASGQIVRGRALTSMVILMATSPIFARAVTLHMNDQTKLVVLIGSLVVVLVIDCIIVPNCLLYARCLDIHRDLSSMLAHLVGVTHYQGGLETRISWLSSGLGHSLWLLRKELNLPEGMLEKVATSTLFGKLNYYSAIGIHFWCGILLISLWLKEPDPSMNPFVDALFFI